MKKEGLTDKQVRYLRASEKREEFAVGTPRGLYIVLHPTGRKTWMFRYRYRGRTRGLTFPAPYPEMTLAAARAEAESAIDQLDKGIDPAVVQVEETEREQPNSAKSVVEEWLKRKVERTRTKGEVRRVMSKYVLPHWQDRYIREIDRPAVLRVVDALTDEKKLVQANRALSIVKRFFNWAIERGYVETSPADALSKSKEKARDRVLADGELVEIWNAARTLEYPSGIWIRFLILTAQRRGEAARITRDDVDMEKALWTLPEEATKSGRVHDVPLSPEVVELLEAAPAFTEGDFIFTTTSGERPISGFSKIKTAIDRAIVESRKETAKDPKKVEGLARWTWHDLRRTASTWMAKNGVPPHVLAAILNHTPGSTQGVTHIYNRFRYTEERRAALKAWAGFVVSLTAEKVKKAAAS